MTVRAKFKVDSVTKRPHWDKISCHLHDIELSVVHGDSEENKKFFAATPTGTIKVQSISAEAGELFEPGAEYYIDFTRAV